MPTTQHIKDSTITCQSLNILIKTQCVRDIIQYVTEYPELELHHTDGGWEDGLGQQTGNDSNLS